MGRPPTPESERFWAKVRVADEDACWPWVGSTDRGGYGQFRRSAAHGFSMIKAHVFANITENGAPPEGKPLSLHACDNPPCCNPKHLFYGDHQDNSDDKWRKGRGHRLYGDKNGMWGRKGEASPSHMSNRWKRYKESLK